MISFKYLLALTALIAICTISANAQTKFVEKKIGHVYYMNIPDYMTTTKDLNDVASLQYQNTLKEAYVIVIEDCKDTLEALGVKFTNPQDFYDGFIGDFSKGLEDKQVTSTKNMKINGNDAVQAELSGTFNGHPIWYLITVVESPTFFYKIITWTIGENKDKLKADYIKMVNSFHE
jgi:hypothetical protein